ncbi:hypothetical protein ACIQZI_13280 [Peribacillus sp. NPDC096379]|uniref:hypothetical protein n=1 Tax=Peribacillus sp. NPDC096379 TaxID=3364393 RepID=UPI00381F4F27
MAIPKEISRIHVLEALEKTKRVGIESYRQSTGYDLVFKGQRYPPKEVLHLASFEAVGREVDILYGGDQTNDKLINLGFEIVIKNTDIEIGLVHVRTMRLKKKEQNEEIELEILIEDIESEEIEQYEPRAEGAVVTIYGSRYERDATNRKRAIEIHGLSCKVCGLILKKFMGLEGRTI